jgi:hypothetical protein
VITKPVPSDPQFPYYRSPIAVEGTVTDDSGPQDLAVAVNGLAAEVQNGRFTVLVSAADGPLALIATGFDGVGNHGPSAPVSIVVDSTPPVITITPPVPTLTRQGSIVLAGTVADDSPVTVAIDGLNVPVTNGSFSRQVSLAAGANTFVVTARDAALNDAAPKTVAVTRDSVPPRLTINHPNTAVVYTSSVAADGEVEDDSDVAVTLDGQPASMAGIVWNRLVSGLAEGQHDFVADAIDAAQNDTTVTRSVVVDLNAPIVQITSPLPAFTTTANVALAGTVYDWSLQTLTVGGTATPFIGESPSHTFAAPFTLAENENHIEVAATDGANRRGTQSVDIVLDTTPPELSPIQAPSTLAPGTSASASVQVNERHLDRVVWTVPGMAATTQTQPPFAIDFTVPSGLNPGETFIVAVEAFDKVGHHASIPKTIRVAASGVVTGQVLSDETGQPLAGATARLVSGAAGTFTSDARGRYSLPTGAVSAVLVVEKSGYTTVERTIAITPAKGTVPVDARLTKLSADPPEADTLTSGPLTLSSLTSTARVTLLSAQGLPSLLPMGWSPLAVFDLRGEGASAVQAAVNVAREHVAAIHLVEYRPATHAWHLVVADVANDAVRPLPGAGVFAFVVPDTAALQPPPIGEALEGVDMVLLPADATSQGSVTPATLPPAGGIARGRVVVGTSTAVPAGTVIQAQVSETYTLTDGREASEEPRRVDIVLFHEPASSETGLTADFPIQPTRTYESGQLRGRRVHLDLLAGREGVRGVIGGNEPVTATLDGIQLTIPAAALAHDVAFGIGTSGLSSFVPQSANLTALDEVSIDFSGETLEAPAELSIDGTNLSPDSTYLVARVDRFDGVPYMVVVAKGELQAGRLVARAGGGLPGIRTEGRFVFYRTSVPMGFIAGSIANAARTPLIVSTSVGAFPFAALVLGSSYLLPAVDGPAALDARVPGTPLHGSGSTTVVANETATLNLTLIGTATHATITPLNGAVDFPAEGVIEITADERFRADSITAANIQLHDITVTAAPTPISLRFVVSGNGRALSVIPTSPALKPKTPYRLTMAGLVDVFGQSVQIPSVVTFTTRAEQAPEWSPEDLTLSFPDSQGQVHVKVPADKLPSGTQVLVINTTSAFVASFSIVGGVALDDTMPATLNDRLLVTITYPDGNITTFTKSTFIGPNGETAVNSGGGVVHAKDDPRYEIRIPEGALEKGVIFEAEVYTPAAGDPLPEVGTDAEFPDAISAFGAGLRWKTSDPTVKFKKEVDLAYPVPPVPEEAAAKGYTTANAYYHIFRRIHVGENADGTPQYAFRAIDDARIEGEGASARVVTKSPPYQGVRDVFAVLKVSLAVGSPVMFMGASAAESAMDILMVAYEVLPRPVRVGITGTVMRPEYVTTTDPVTGQTTTKLVNKGVSGATVFLDPRPLLTPADWLQEGFAAWRVYPKMFSATGDDGRFALSMIKDSAFGNYYVRVMTEDGTTAVARLGQVAPPDRFALGMDLYRNSFATAVTLPALPKKETPSDVSLQLFKKKEDGKREPLTSGFVLKDTTLIVGVKIKNEGDELRTLELVRDSGTENIAFQTEYLPKDDPLAQKFVGELEADTAGTYKLTATVLNTENLPIPVTQTFRVIASGNGSFTHDPKNAPQVVTSSVVPKVKTPAATGVPVTVTPQLTFTEPVKNVVGGATIRLVKLTGGGEEAVDFKLTAVAIDANDQPYVIPELSDPTARVSSLTLTPIAALEYGVTYELRATEAIVDFDTPEEGGPRSLDPFGMKFETFKPVALTEPGGQNLVGSPGLVVLRDRAYLADMTLRPVNAYLHTFDISDPVAPREIEPAAFAQGRAVDLAGEIDTDGLVVAAGGRYVAMPTVSLGKSRPSNINIFDVTNDGPVYLGAVSATSSAFDGNLWRLIVKDGIAYASTVKKGIQIVDLGAVAANFPKAPLSSTDPGGVAYWAAVRDLNTDGRGWGQEYVSTIPVRVAGANGQPVDYTVADLKVDDFVVSGSPQTLIFGVGGSYSAAAEGLKPLVSVNRLDIQDIRFFDIVKRVPDPANPGEEKEVRIDLGGSIELTQLRDTRVAVVSGLQRNSRPALAVLSLDDPSHPVTLSILEDVGGYLLVRDGKAYLSGISYTEVYDLMPALDGLPPTYLGRIDGVGGTIAFNEDGSILYGSSRLNFGLVGNGAEVDKYAGVKAAALGPLPLVRTDPARILASEKAIRSVEPFKLKYRFIGNSEIKFARIEFVSVNAQGETIVGELEAPIATDGPTQGTGERSLPFGYVFARDAEGKLARARLTVFDESGVPISGPFTNLNLSEFEVSLAGNEENDFNEDNNETAPPLRAGEGAGYLGDASAGNDELLKRNEDAIFAGRQPDVFNINWRQTGGVQMLPPAQQSNDGQFDALLEGRKLSNTLHQVQALAGDIVLGTSEPVPMLAGPPDTVTVTPLSGPGANHIVPADGGTEVVVRIEVKDKDGNAVLDDTPVLCSVEGYGQIIGEANPLTVAGRATCTYRAGTVVNRDIIRAEVEDVVAEIDMTTLAVRVEQIFLDKTDALVGEEVTATIFVTSDADDMPADGSPVGWLTEGTFLQKDLVLKTGSATAKLRFDDIGIYAIHAIVGGGRNATDVGISSPEAGLRIEQTHRLVAGDVTQDTTVALENIDGSTTNVFVPASGTIRISGGVPGQTVRLGLGSLDAPNRQAEARYLMDALDSNVVRDILGRHHGHASGDVAVEGDATREAAYAFGGAGTITIPAEGALQQTNGLTVTVSFNPAAGAGAESSIIRRDGAFALKLVPSDELYVVRLSAFSDGHEVTLDHPMRVSQDTWTTVSAGLEPGELSLIIGDDIATKTIGALDVGSGEIVVGESFAGRMDDLALYHSSGASPPLLLLRDAQGDLREQVTTTFDASGAAEFSFFSAGVLGDAPPDEDPIESLRKRQNMVGLRTWAADQLQKRNKKNNILVFGKDAAAMFTLLGTELIGGPSHNTPVPFLLADAFYSLFPPTAIAMTYRDGVIAAEGVLDSKPVGWTGYLNMAAVPLVILESRLKKLEKAGQALQALRQLAKIGVNAEKLSRWAVAAQRDAILAKRLEKILEVLTTGDAQTIEALAKVIGTTEVAWKHIDNLESLLRVAGDVPGAARALKAVAEAGADGPKVLHAVLEAAAWDKTATLSMKALTGLTKAVKSDPGTKGPRLFRKSVFQLIAKNFPGQTGRLWEKIDDVADETTLGLRLVVRQLSTLTKPGVKAAEGAEAVLDYGKTLVQAGNKIDGFELRVAVDVGKRWMGPVTRVYDIAIVLGGKLIHIDVKKWSFFSPKHAIFISEGKKLMKDLVIKGQPPSPSYDTLQWAIPKVLKGQEAAIKNWMKALFDTRYVRSRFRDSDAFDRARKAFFTAVDDGSFLRFF